ncbi:adenine nucleotide alpha hydrolase [Nocardia vinacea]|uniref:Adenine nucleotide alpha hydrolase n=1 Tax=Nocardia vinacea TaxID=96468 RepID=A0ABZ1YTW9_9NOCA|nr:adenine nucleotide alpha hydrolase [Nocardia vinacea]
MNARTTALARRLDELGPTAIAVSGGVDSMTLATFAHRHHPGRTVMYHAISAAVPPEATERVRRYAAAEGWPLHIIDSGEFADRNYLDNPVDRCFFCKEHLYGAIASRTDSTVVSGTNTDDLADFRPGLAAARRFGVVHPYVDAGIDKQGIRAIARILGLTDVADLPAAPCLASRVETGITIRPETLGSVHRVERELTDILAPQAIRCRVRSNGITIELDTDTLLAMSPGLRTRVTDLVSTIWPNRTIRIESYRQGSATTRNRPTKSEPDAPTLGHTFGQPSDESSLRHRPERDGDGHKAAANFSIGQAREDRPWT